MFSFAVTMRPGQLCCRGDQKVMDLCYEGQNVSTYTCIRVMSIFKFGCGGWGLCRVNQVLVKRSFWDLYMHVNNQLGENSIYHTHVEFSFFLRTCGTQIQVWNVEKLFFASQKVFIADQMNIMMRNITFK